MRPEVIRYVLLYGAVVTGMHLVDGPWKKWTKGKAIDPWTWTHVAWGSAGKIMGLTATEMFLLASANEVIEFGFRKTRPDLLWGTPESAANVTLDVAANMAGYYGAEAILPKPA